MVTIWPRGHQDLKSFRSCLRSFNHSSKIDFLENHWQLKWKCCFLILTLTVKCFHRLPVENYNLELLCYLARLPIAHTVILLYLCIADFDRDLISLEITLNSSWVHQMENYVLLMFPLPLKHNTLSRSYQFLLVFQTAFFCFTNSSERVLTELPLSKVFKLWSWKTRWCSPFLSQYIPSLQTRFAPCAISEINRAAVIERVVWGLNQSRVARYRELGKLLSSLTWWWCFYIKSVMRHTYYNFRFTKWNKKYPEVERVV